MEHRVLIAQDAALKNIQEAIAAYVESLKARNDLPPATRDRTSSLETRR